MSNAPRNILVVEDHPTNRKLLRVTLEAEGFTVFEAADGVEALAVLGQAKIDALVSDILMPRMDGFRLCHEVRKNEQFRDLPFIIYTSAYTSSSDEKLALRVGVDKYLRKPVPIKTMVQALGEVCARPRLESPGRAQAPDESDVMKQYSEVLVRKLENTNDDLARAASQQEGLAGLSHHALASGDVVVLINEALRLLKKSLHVDHCGAWELLPDGRNLLLRAGVGWKAGLVGSATISSSVTDPQTAFLTKAIHSGQPVIVERPDAEKQSRTFHLLLDQQVVSGVSVAIQGSSAAWGVLSVHTTTPWNFRTEDVHFLQSVANLLSAAINRRQIEEALRHSEERFRLLVAEVKDYAIFMLDPDGCVLTWNAGAERVKGYAPQEIVGQHFSRFYTPEDVTAGKPQRDLTIAVEQGEYAEEGWRVRKDGSRFWAAVTITAIRGPAGELRGFAKLTRDATDRKRAEEALQAARISAEQAKATAEQANRAKDHFLAVLSHELRTPLTPVVMGLSMLRDRPDLDSTMRETLDMMYRNVELEVRLIDDLLDVSRIVRGKIELSRNTVELCTVIRRAVEVCELDIKARRVHFGVDFGPAAPYWVEADVPRLQQVFWNLLKNAIKFTPHGGCVGIRCRPKENYVVVEVNDSGIGIEPEALSRVFDAFEQTDRLITQQFGGLGLGLAISRAMVEMHGGQIEAHSEGRDKGATFRVRLPLTAPPGQPEVRAPASRVVRPLRILQVEDHGVTAKMMQWVLTEEGHEVQTAGDVATALELAGQCTFDLLLSDLGLPDGSGYDLMRQLRQRGHRFPGIALSGYGQTDDILRSHDAGFAAHLTKPASREAVVEAIASATAAK